MRHLAGLFACLLIAPCVAATAAPAGLPARAGSVVGSRNVTVADPPAPRPGTRPCVVQLFPTERFGKRGNDARMDATPHAFAFQPPAQCPGPWAKVVLEADFSVDAGHQYDRTASIWLDDVAIYFGTTEEPSPGVARRWKVQRDVTDYSALFRRAGTIDVRINNWLGPVFSSPIHAGARLLFYPADAAYPAPVVPDRVYALNGHTTAPAKLDRDSNRLSRTLRFPRNTTRVYLDVFAQPQAHDEFYYVCLPDAVIKRTGRPQSNGSLDRSRACDGGSFREVMVSIDGQRAGLAPVTPWVFTGGLDPFLWQPTPAPEALNFIPYRVDLSPFAGLLSDGKPHTVSVRMLGTPHFFSLAAALLVYRDARVKHTGGAVTRNTLQAATLKPAVTDSLTGNTGRVNGGIFTHANTHYVIEGYVDTPAGRVESRVDTTIAFDNTQRFVTGDSGRRRHLSWQHARVDATSRTTRPGAPPRSLRKIIDYTLDAHTLSRPGTGKDLHRAVQLRQRFQRHTLQRQPGLLPYVGNMSNTMVAAGKLVFQRGKRETYRSRDQSSTQTFRFDDSLGDCYRAQVQARDRQVLGVSRGQGCIDHGRMHWFVHPDGSPDSFGWRGRVTTHPSAK